MGRVYSAVAKLYAPKESLLPFHGWGHVDFVYRNAIRCAEFLGADVELVGLAALTHDLNYLVSDSLDAAEGLRLARELLLAEGVELDRVLRVMSIILEARTSHRGPDISRDAMALSDGDSLYKCLPITPVALAPGFLRENSMSLCDLARKIVREQRPLLDQDIFFYSAEYRSRYGDWARINVALWEAIERCLDDDEIVALLADDLREDPQRSQA